METPTPSHPRTYHGKYRDRLLFVAVDFLKANGVEDVIVGDLAFLEAVDAILAEISAHTQP